MNYENLLLSISTTYESGKAVVLQSINRHLVQTYWNIGQHIIEFEQKGEAKAVYGDGLLKQLSKDLKQTHGKGFSLSLHIDINMVSLDCTTTILTSICSHSFDFNFGSKWEFGRTSNGVEDQ